MHQEKQLEQLKTILPLADCTISLLEIITQTAEDECGDTPVPEPHLHPH